METIKAVVYERATGRIEGVINAPVDVVQMSIVEAADYVVAADDPDTRQVYVDIGANPPAVVDRPTLPVTHSALHFTVDEDVTFDGVPIGAVLHHPDGQSVISEGSVSWGSDLAGEYLLRITHFPYVEGVYRVKVNPA